MTDRYTLSLHDALPILGFRSQHLDVQPVLDARQDAPVARLVLGAAVQERAERTAPGARRQEVDGAGLARQGEAVAEGALDRKSTRLNSSHRCISYAVFC